MLARMGVRVVVVLVLGDSFSAPLTPGCTALRTKRVPMSQCSRWGEDSQHPRAFGRDGKRKSTLAKVMPHVLSQAVASDRESPGEEWP